MKPHTSSFLFLCFSATVFAGAVPSAPFGQNLLQNPGAELALSGWTATGDVIASGDWQTPVSGSFVFNTSYGWASLAQSVDLVAAGFNAAELDAGATITFSQWVGARFDAGAEYYISVRLLDGQGVELAQQGAGSVGAPPDLGGGLDFGDEGGIPGDEFSSGPSYVGESLAAGSGWVLKSYSFTNVVGARSVSIEVAGKDAMGWGGYYGASFDDASLSLTASAIPEPASAAMLLGLAALGGGVLRRRARA